VISSVFHRRRSERLAQLIEEAGGGRRHHVRSGVDSDLADLVAVSRRLADLPVKVEAHPEFRDGLRAMLLATIERDGIGTTATAPESGLEPARRRGARTLVAGGARRRPAGPRPPLARRTKARGAIVIGLAAGTLALSGMSAASGDAIPGDPLYSVKRSTERAQLALAGSDISRGQLYLEFARTRLDEARAVRTDAAGLSQVLDDMDRETQQGIRLLTTTAVERKDPAALDAIDTFVSTQRTAATRLRDGVSGVQRTRAGDSLVLLEQIQQRSTGLRQVLKCGATATETPDALGPRPKGVCKTTGERPSGPNGQPNSGMLTGTNAPVGGTSGTPGANSSGSKVTVETGTPATSGSPSPSGGGLLGGLNDIVGGR
jgi:hypothetical protein